MKHGIRHSHPNAEGVRDWLGLGRMRCFICRGLGTTPRMQICGCVLKRVAQSVIRVRNQMQDTAPFLGIHWASRLHWIEYVAEVDKVSKAVLAPLPPVFLALYQRLAAGKDLKPVLLQHRDAYSRADQTLILLGEAYALRKPYPLFPYWRYVGREITAPILLHELPLEQVGRRVIRSGAA